MKTKPFVFALVLIVSSGALTVAQQKTAPESKLVEFQMVLFKRPAEPKQFSPAELSKLREDHTAYIMGLLESGKAVIAGPLADEGDIRSVSVLRATSKDEAKVLAEKDPFVKEGFLAAEIHPWWSEEVMKKPSLPVKMTTAYLGFLVRGSKWTPEKTPQTEELQKAHLANIIRLAEMKKLVVAGPFGDDGQLRGIFVFKVGSLEEANALAATDPAVQAGRLSIVMRTWYVPEGILP